MKRAAAKSIGQMLAERAKFLQKRRKESIVRQKLRLARQGGAEHVTI